MMRNMLLIAVVLGGCWGTTTAGQGPNTTLVPPDQEQPPETHITWQPRNKQSPCDLAIARAFETAKDELQRVARLKDQLDEVRAAATESCKATSWSQETLDCFTNAAIGTEVIRCTSRLTSEQNTDMERRMNDIFNKSTPTPPPMP